MPNYIFNNYFWYNYLMRSTTKEGKFGETPYRVTLEQIEPGKIVAGVRIDLGYRGVAIEFPGLQKSEEEGAPYVSWQLPLRNPSQIIEGLRTVFANDPPPQVLQGTTEIINEFSDSSTEA